MTQIKNILLCSLLAALFNLVPPTQAQALDPRAEPEAATSSELKKVFHAKHHLIVAANPHASRAGRHILRLGGSAIDAAIAAQMVLNLVEPQSSGIGGGAFLLHWDKEQHRLSSFDGRETAPLAATPDRFMKDGKPMAFLDAKHGGLSVGTPGVLRMLELAHRRYGRLPWAQLFDPAIKLATQGFLVSSRLNTLLTKARPDSFGPQAKAYFFDDQNKPRPVGYRLKNKPFAQALSGIALYGADFFYRGPLATHMAQSVQHSPGQKGDMTVSDLAAYQAFERPPVCVSYRTYKVCGMGPPSSGMLTIAQILKLIEPFDLGKQPLNSRALHIIAEAGKLAYADRKRYMADSDFVHMPEGLLDERYLAKRSRLISSGKTIGKATPGHPPFRQGKLVRHRPYGIDATQENNGTSHLSIIDGWGNAVSMTTSIEAAFGARLMVSGFLLNNELTDFSFRPTDKHDRLIANRVTPLKRPRSSMAPTMVFDQQGRLHMVVGSPGGSRIIVYVLKTLIGHIDWGLDGDVLTRLPNFGSRNGPLELEKGPGAETIASKLQTSGHKIRITPMTSGVHLILQKGNRLTGAADPRREGVPLGD